MMMMMMMEEKIFLGRLIKTYLCFQDDDLLSTLDAIIRWTSLPP
jgi:hypothetical protein